MNTDNVHRRSGIALAAVVVAVAAVILVSNARSSSPSSSHTSRSSLLNATDALHDHDTHEHSIRYGATSDLFRFERVADMVVNSHLVVVGRVVAAEQGRTYNPEDGDGALTARQLTIDPSRILFGTHDERNVIVEEIGWEGGTELRLNGAVPAEAGEQGVFFLRRMLRDSEELGYPIYNLVSSQGRFTELPRVTQDQEVESASSRRPGQQLRGSNAHDPLVQAVEMMTVDDLEASVRDAVAMINRGDVAPWPVPEIRPLK